MSSLNPRLSSYKALCFDVYGTLIDWESGIYDALQPLLQRAGQAWTRSEALTAYCSVESDLQAKHPTMLYAELLGTVYGALADRLSTTSTAEENAGFGASIARWSPFPDTVPALAALAKHYKLCVLSNVDVRSFGATRAVLEQGFAFTRVLTAQEAGAYKPAPTGFEMLLAELEAEHGVRGEQVLVVAQSLMHDHVPANRLGLSSAFIDREGATIGNGVTAHYTYKFATLGEFAEAVEAER